MHPARWPAWRLAGMYRTRISRVRQPIRIGSETVSLAGCCTRSKGCSMRIWTRRVFARRRARSWLRLAAPQPPGASYQTACSTYQKTRGTQGVSMKMRIQLIIEDASGATTSTDIAALERKADDLI